MSNSGSYFFFFKVMGAFCLFLVGLGVMLGGVLFGESTPETSQFQANLLMIVETFIGLGAALAVLYAIYRLAREIDTYWQRRKLTNIDSRGLMSVNVDSLKRGDYDLANMSALMAYHQTQLEFARNSGQVPQTFNYHPNITQTNPQLAAPVVPQLPNGAGIVSFSGVQVKLKGSPHWLLIGKTESGKTTASWAMLERLNQKYDCLFVVCEKNGTQWHDTNIITLPQIHRTIELTKLFVDSRNKQLRQLKVEDVSKTDWRRLIVVIEETETTLEAFRLSDKKKKEKGDKLYDDFVSNLHAIATEGRKCGIHLVVISQKGKAAQIPSEIRDNLDGKLLMKSTIGTGRMFELDKETSALLPDLEVGIGYFTPANTFIKMPLVSKPNLPLIELSQLENMVLNNPTSLPENATCEVVSSRDRLDTGLEVFKDFVDSEMDSETYQIETWLKEGKSGNWIIKQLGGDRNRRLKQIREIRNMLDSQKRS